MPLHKACESDHLLFRFQFDSPDQLLAASAVVADSSNKLRGSVMRIDRLIAGKLRHLRIGKELEDICGILWLQFSQQQAFRFEFRHLLADFKH